MIDAGDAPWLAVFGDRMGKLAMENQLAGIMVNVCIRDSDEINGMDIGIKALGTIPSRASLSLVDEVDQPVIFEGVKFVPEARLVADEDGVILPTQGVSELDVDMTSAFEATARSASKTYATALD